MPNNLRSDIDQLYGLVEDLRSAMAESRQEAEVTAQVSRELSEALLNGLRRPRPSARKAPRRSVPPVQTTLELSDRPARPNS